MPPPSDPQPVAGYAEALSRVRALQARDDGAVNPLCRTQLLSHGRTVEHAIVCLHGFTNCPQQFARLAGTFHARGCNVLNARIPHHGLQDRLTPDIARLDARELFAVCGELLDLAHGLGERITLVGMSLGATLALWAAQQRADLDRAVAIAPLIAPANTPRPLLPVLVWLAERLPNFFVWWDSARKENLPGPRHAYPRFPTRGLAVVLRIAQQIEAGAARLGAVPRARAVLLVTNANDPAVDNRASRAIVQRWRANGAARAEMYEFDASLRLIHDIVDDQQPEQRTDIVYPILIDLIKP